MKKELIVSMLLVLTFLSFLNLLILNPAAEAQPSEPTVIGNTNVFGHSYQRYTFYANGRFWAFYSYQSNIVYKTSTDGSTWSTATTVRAVDGWSQCPEFSVWFDGSYIHYAKGQSDHVANTSLYYRMGVPNVDGTITWNATEQIVAPAVENRSYRAPQIITDSDGYPVITYLNRTYGGWPWEDFVVSVAKSSTKNGIWTDAAGFPAVVTNEVGWPFSVPLTNGKLYTMWSLDNGTIRGALYNGADWESFEDCTSNFVGSDQYGACAVAYGDNVHLAYIGNETATKIYRYVKRTYGSGWGNETVVKNVTGASGNQGSISLTVDQSKGNLWMWFNTTDNKIAYRKYIASTSSWDTYDTYPFGDSFTSPYYITASYQVHDNKIPVYWQEGTTTPYDLVFGYLTADTVPPTIEILSPENTTYGVSDVPFSFTVSESTSWMGYSLDGQANSTIVGNTTLSSLLDGSHYVAVYANDTAGNMGASSPVYFTVDATPPNITAVSQTPLKDNVEPEDEVNVNATVTDEVSGVKQVTLNYTNGNGTWIPVTMTNLEGNIWNATIPAFPQGTNVTYRIIAEDNVNNTITSEDLGYECQYIVIPEFPAWTPMLLTLMALTVAIAIYKRRLKTPIH